MRSFASLALATFLASWCLAAGAEPPATVPGGLFVAPLPAGVARATFQGDPVLVHAGHAIVGLPLSLQPGHYELLPDGAQPIGFHVTDRQYPEQRLTIENPRMVNPDPESLARIREESARQRAHYESFSDRDLDIVPFLQPVDGITSSSFGRRRVLNGQPRSPHSGLDIAADTGTPIIAPAPGRVLLTDDLYFNGNTVFLDHGQGLVTMYCHMSAIAVAEGDEVRRGQTLGQVGATGRVTGPHLHWSVSLNGTRVDPAMVMALLRTPTPVTAAGEGR